MNYLVILTGYEGIEELIGLFDRAGAIRKIKNMRRRNKRNADFYCIQRVDAKGAKCVCCDLGVPASRPMLR